MTWRNFIWRPSHSEALLLDRLDQERQERRVQAALRPRTGQVTPAPQRPPLTYRDGTRDQLCRNLDVIADLLAAPKDDPNEVAATEPPAAA